MSACMDVARDAGTLHAAAKVRVGLDLWGPALEVGQVGTLCWLRWGASGAASSLVALAQCAGG